MFNPCEKIEYDLVACLREAGREQGPSQCHLELVSIFKESLSERSLELSCNLVWYGIDKLQELDHQFHHRFN